MTDAPAKENLRSMTEFADAFDSPDFVAGEWTSPVVRPDGVIEVGYWMAGDCVMRWEQAVYDRQVVDPDSAYLSERFSRQMDSYIHDPSRLREADLATVRTVITNVVRGERFCEGYMAEMFECGVAQAATRRLVELAEE